MTQVPLPHELVPEPVLNEHFDRETIRRGRAYAESGQVLQVRTGRESGGVTLSGAVAGTRLSPYDVEVYVAQDRGRMTLYTDCTCPVEIECKHAVALVLAANAANAANAASGETGAGGGNASSVPAEGTDGSGWAFLLDRSLSELEQHAPAAGDAIPLGLLFEHKLTQYRWQRAPVRSLQIRPVQRGRREAWVKTGAGWSEVMYSLPARRQHDPGQLVALAEMVPAFGAYAHNPDLLQVGPLLWPLLRRAVDAGIELVPGAGLTAVELADDPLELEADLTSPGQAIDVRLGVRYGAASSEHLEHAWWPGEDRDLVFLGRTGHGVALLRSVTPPGRRRTPHSELVLARLARPVPEGVQMLVGSGQGVVVPDVGRDRLLDEFVPRLRRQLPIGSGDGSVEIPDEVPPRLVLEIRWQAPHEIETSWWWRYGDGDGHRLPIDSSIDSSSGRPATAGKGLATVTGIGGPVGGPTRGPSSGPMSSAMSSPMSSAVENEGLATLRNPMAERAVLAELDLAGRTGIEVDGQGRPVAQQTWGGRELLVFVNRVLPVLRDSGLVDVEEIGEQPDYREAETDPLVFFELAEAAGDREGTADAVTDWLDLTVRITVDGEDVPLAMVLACLTLGSELVFTPSGRHLPADHPAFAKLAELVAAAGQLVEQPSDGVRVGRRDLSLWAELADTGVVDAQAAQWVEAAQKLRDLERLPEVTPSGLKSELRPYQRSGLQWLAFLWKAQLGGILADDMGLGKTLQALALVGHARESGAAPFLVVAPTSVVSAWAHEAAAHVPGLAVRTVTASAARREKSIADLYAEADLVVTTYTLLRLEADAYAEQAWGGLILDEAQQIKNHQGRTYQAVRRLDVPFRLALTGTPFENRLMELWSLLSVTAPGLYPWPARFKELVAGPVERQGDGAALERFRRRIRPFLLRRTKEMVAADLPPKQEQVLEVGLNARHRKIYDTHLQRERQTVLGLVDDFEHNRIAIFRALTRLRQLSLDPALLDAGYDKVGSAKLDALVEHLHELVSEGHRALVFSQFTSYLARVRARLTDEGIDFAYLDGRTAHRGRVIEGFKNGEVPVFLISLKAGGVGLTLTEADYVFVLDPWWNPAVEAQAVDRTHRIGQRKTVMVYRLVAEDTIEQKVMELKERKAALFAQVVDGGGAMAADITVDDVRAIFG